VPCNRSIRRAGLAAVLLVVALPTVGCGDAGSQRAPVAGTAVQPVDITPAEERAIRADLRRDQRHERAATARENRRIAQAARREAATPPPPPPPPPPVAPNLDALRLDSIAKSAARNAVSQIESCAVDAQTYVGCDSLGEVPDLPPGVVVSAATDRTYTATALSDSGHTFRIARNAAGLFERTCSGCATGFW
jgi:hypothetical protein